MTVAFVICVNNELCSHLLCLAMQSYLNTQLSFYPHETSSFYRTRFYIVVFTTTQEYTES